jgi:drug/metabolite transporter (DMT)-like permease
MCVIWGVPYLLIKVAVVAVSPVLLVFLRTAIGAALLLPVAVARRQLRPLLPHWRILIAYTAAEVAIPWLFLSDAETRLSSSLSGLLIAAVPLVGAVLVRLTGDTSDGDRLGTTRLAGLLIGLAGVGALLGLDLHAGDGWALAEIAVTVVGYATGPIIINRRLSTLPSTGVIAASLTLAAVSYAPWALTHLPARTPPADAMVSAALLGVVCTATAFLLFFALIAEIGPARATVITYVNPAVAVLLGVTLGGEHFTAGMAFGFPLVLAGSYFAARRPRRRAPAVAEKSAPAAVEVA